MRKSDEWQHRIVRDSKRSDLLKGHYDPSNSIDTEFLLAQNEKQRTMCFYCEIPMAQHNRNIRQGLTLERLDVVKGHTKDNCVLCCKSCNSKKVHRDKGLIERLLVKWNTPVYHVWDSGRRPCLV